MSIAGSARSAERGDEPRPATGAKRKDNLRFSFLFELLPFRLEGVKRRNASIPTS